MGKNSLQISLIIRKCKQSGGKSEKQP